MLTSFSILICMKVLVIRKYRHLTGRNYLSNVALFSSKRIKMISACLYLSTGRAITINTSVKRGDLKWGADVDVD